MVTKHFIHKERDVISHINFLSTFITFHLDVISNRLKEIISVVFVLSEESLVVEDRGTHI